MTPPLYRFKSFFESWFLHSCMTSAIHYKNSFVSFERFKNISNNFLSLNSDEASPIRFKIVCFSFFSSQGIGSIRSNASWTFSTSTTSPKICSDLEQLQHGLRVDRMSKCHHRIYKILLSAIQPLRVFL